MNTREVAAEYRLTHWAQIIQERSESGLSVKEFCKNAGFHENIYYYWQRKLREAACDHLTTLQPGAARTSLAPHGFAEVEVKVKEPPVPFPILEDTRRGELCVEVAGVRITADGAYPTQKIVELLRGLTPS